MQIQFIGCGIMGQVLLQAFIDAKYPTSNIFVSEKNPDNIKKIKRKYKINIGINPKTDILILAVKPQHIGTVNFTPFGKNTLIFSIMAGITIKKLKMLSGNKNIVRAMPNTPLSVSRGVMGYVQGKHIDQKKMQVLKKVFAPVGKMIQVKNEDYIDKIAALSGSGPAYFFYLTEIIQKQAQKFGFTLDEAEMIARETLIGSAKLLDHSGLPASQLRKNVTSKGGTTQAALETMKKKGLDKSIQASIMNAYKKAKKLSK